MNLKMEKRVLQMGEQFVLQKEQHPTVRSMAYQTGYSKSSVHKDLTERLKECDHSLYLEVQEILKQNSEEKHIHGGMASKQKRLKYKKN